MHLNTMIAPLGSVKGIMKQLVLAVWPSLLLTEAEQNTFPGPGGYFKMMLRESGYFHIQSTRPDTVGKAHLPPFLKVHCM